MTQELMGNIPPIVAHLQLPQQVSLSSRWQFLGFVAVKSADIDDKFILLLPNGRTVNFIPNHCVNLHFCFDPYVFPKVGSSCKPIRQEIMSGMHIVVAHANGWNYIFSTANKDGTFKHEMKVAILICT